MFRTPLAQGIFPNIFKPALFADVPVQASKHIHFCPQHAMPSLRRLSRNELLRKSLHLLALAIPAGIYILDKPLALFVLLPLSLVAIGADVLRTRSEGFAHFIARFFGYMMRPTEVPAIGENVVLNGATWVVVSATFLTLLFPVDVVVPGFASFMAADAAAAITGIRFGRTPWPGTHRTLEGSIAFAIIAWVVLLPFGHIPMGTAALVALAGAVVEAQKLPINDNIRAPFVMTAVLWIAVG